MVSFDSGLFFDCHLLWLPPPWPSGLGRPPRERRTYGSIPACTNEKKKKKNSHVCWDFSLSSHTSDFKTDTPVATLPDCWQYRVSTGTGWPSVGVLRLGEIENLMCNFCL